MADIVQLKTKLSGNFIEIVLAVVGILGFIFFVFTYDQVFPAASIDLKLSKAEINKKAKILAKKYGFREEGSISSTTFAEDSYSSIFLEREFSMSQANVLMKEEIPIWYWQNRFCRPFTFEEMRLNLSPAGKLLFLSHTIENERSIQSVSHTEAMNLALSFLESETDARICLKQAQDNRIELLPGIKLIQDGTHKEAHRVDHSFVWENKQKDYRGAHMRISVTVSGNKVTFFSYNLHVPELFGKKYHEIRSYNELLKSVSSVLYMVLSVCIIFAFIWGLSTKLIRWRLVLFASLLSFLFGFLDTWNYFPSLLSNYDTTKSIEGYFSEILLESILDSLKAAFGTLLLLGGVELVYRLSFPQAIAFEKVVMPNLWKNKKILQVLLIGIFSFGIHLAWVSFYYLFGQKIGIWSPLDIRETNTLSSIVPAFSSFNIGINASISEELMYRVLCLVLAQKLLKNSFLANLVQALGWAFMHSDYPQEPPYARGLELSIIGLFYGFIIKRYGVAACIISHFTYDAFLGVCPLLLSKSMGLISSGILAFAFPFIALSFGLIGRLKDRIQNTSNLVEKAIKLENLTETVDSKNLANENVILVKSSASVMTDKTNVQNFPLSISFNPMSWKQRSLCVLCICLFILPFYFVKIRALPDWTKLTVNKSEVEKISLNFLEKNGIKLDKSWSQVAILQENLDSDEAQYGFEKEGFDKIKQIMQKARVPLIWWVRFFKAFHSEEYNVILSSEGRPLAINVIKEEEAKGKLISESFAISASQEFLKQYRPEFQPLEFESSQEKKLKERTDFYITYVVPSMKLGEARLQIIVPLVGGQISMPWISWNIPESWRFERNKQTIKDQILTVANYILLSVSLIISCLWAIRLVVRQEIDWSLVVKSALLVTVLLFLSQLNNLPSYFVSYSTDTAINTFILNTLSLKLGQDFLWGTLAACLLILFFISINILIPEIKIKNLIKNSFSNNKKFAVVAYLCFDGALLAYLAYTAYEFITLMKAAILSNYSKELFVYSFVPLVNASQSVVPGFKDCLKSFFAGSIMLCASPVAFLAYRQILKNNIYLLLCLLLSVELIVAFGLRNWQDCFLELVYLLILTFLAWLWVRFMAGKNPFAYFFVGFLLVLEDNLVTLQEFASNVLQVNSFILIVLTLFPLLMTCVIYFVNKIFSKRVDEETLG